MTFREFVDSQDQLSTVKTAILNSLGASNDALDDELVNFKNYRKLLNNERNPQFANLISQANNKEAIVKAIENAAVTKISIADLISLFRAGMSGDLPGGRKAPTEPEQEQEQDVQPANQQQPAKEKQPQQPLKKPSRPIDNAPAQGGGIPGIK
jgi:DNA segregation ATPase FtsK/SpoIIIE-like protein